MPKFQGVDFYDVDSLLSEEERMVRDTVRQWVDDALMPVIEEAYIEKRFPTELIPQMAELGIYGANLPEEYGCAGVNYVSYGLVAREVTVRRGGRALCPPASRQRRTSVYTWRSDSPSSRAPAWAAERGQCLRSARGRSTSARRRASRHAASGMSDRSAMHATPFAGCCTPLWHNAPCCSRLWPWLK